MLDSEKSNVILITYLPSFIFKINYTITITILHLIIIRAGFGNGKKVVLTL